jgi:hypothetical protein
MILNCIKGEHRGSFLQGKSTSNVRVERQWRSVGEFVTQMFSTIFEWLKSHQDLDRDSAVDIFCLHHIFLPHLNKALAVYVNAWNHHPMSNRDLKGQSPIGMWYKGEL